MKPYLYLYQWKESNRFALFPYHIELPPTSLYFCGKFDNSYDLFQAVNFFAKKYPNKSISNDGYKTIPLSDYSFEIAHKDFVRFFPNTQLKFDL
jgi:hypothetical protein